VNITGLKTIAIGVVAFVIVDQLLTNMITGTDAGSSLLTSTLRIVTGAVILISAVMFMGKKG
jgi:hypothetical protein